MRPESLVPYFSSLKSLEGVGPALAKNLGRLGLERLKDLLFHGPQGVNHYPLLPHFPSRAAGENGACLVEVVEHGAPTKRGLPYKILVKDGNAKDADNPGLMTLIFFHHYKDSLASRLPPGSKRLVAGRLESYLGTLQMVHPEKILPPERAKDWQGFDPVYPLTAGVTSNRLAGLVAKAFGRLARLPDWHEEEFLTSKNWPHWQRALYLLHHPRSLEDLSLQAPARERLAFDELLAEQISLALVRRHHKKRQGAAITSPHTSAAAILETFGHALTGDQEKALHEILEDLRSPYQMARLLQGDVGCGKTLVALLAMTYAIDGGHQAALLAPTEVLAQQHFNTIAPLLEGTGIQAALLTGKTRAKKKIYEQLSSGEIQLLVGTHALIQEAVKFQDLRLAVIDEQHRFGVEQRLALAHKGTHVDVLSMSATPIPRTLMLTAFGDMETSIIREKPKGRQPIQTRMVNLERLGEVVNHLKGALEEGRQAYWICPLIEESETLDLAAATDRFQALQGTLAPGTVGLIHGRMPAVEKEAVMAAFKAGEISLLVSTTVIEVGVDVPRASIMIIEHAERFGLSQLHQLRGRVGRGSEASSCLLLYAPPLGDIAFQRLTALRDSQDGFHLAEKDLELRGAGDLLGTQQSGLPTYHFADPFFQRDLLNQAREIAREIVESDPTLDASPHLKLLLALFERDRVLAAV